MSSPDITLRHDLATLAKSAGLQVRQQIQAVPAIQRAARVQSKLKQPHETSAYADVVGEEVFLDALEASSLTLGVTFLVIQDVTSEQYLTVGSPSDLVVWCYLDAVDGTVKVAGLGNDSTALRVVNDGIWGLGVAFTDPTHKTMHQLQIDDFSVAAIIDGNPPTSPSFPPVVVALKEHDEWVTYDYSTHPALRLHTSSIKILSQAAAYYDAFQAFDRNSSTPWLEKLAGSLYSQLINRHDGGAFDVWRTYGNLSSLIRCMLGFRHEEGPWHEPQGAAFVVLNENLPNMIPSVPIILGAGGIAVSIDGQSLRNRRLTEGRASVCYAANNDIMNSMRSLFSRCMNNN